MGRRGAPGKVERQKMDNGERGKSDASASNISLCNHLLVQCMFSDKRQ